MCECWSGLEILTRTDASIGLTAAVELDAIFEPTRKCRKMTEAGDILNLALWLSPFVSCFDKTRRFQFVHQTHIDETFQWVAP